MPLPKLIHPVLVTFELMDRVETLWDEQAREPVRQVTRKLMVTDDDDVTSNTLQITIKGQVSYYFAGAKLDYPRFDRSGIIEETTAYVTLRFVDMLKKGLLVLDENKNFDHFVLKRGDRIIRLAKRSVNFYVSGFKDFAHYPNYGQTLIQVNFEDRHPSAQSGDL